MSMRSDKFVSSMQKKMSNTFSFKDILIHLFQTHFQTHPTGFTAHPFCTKTTARTECSSLWQT